MSGIIDFLERNGKKIFWYSVFIAIGGNIIYPSLLSFLKYKQDFIYLLSSSPLVGYWATFGFCIFIFLIGFTFYHQISENL